MATLYAVICRLPETERSARSSHLTAAVDIAELVELDLIFWEVVICQDRNRESWLDFQESLKLNSAFRLLIHLWPFVVNKE